MRRNNPGAEAWLGAEVKVLDKGFIQLVDYMGDDTTIVESARVSYGRAADTEDVAGNARLVNYLMKHDHGTPFEQVSLVFNVKAPLFIFAEWHRHRTAKLNQISSRYTELPEEVYVPEPDRVCFQSKSNKQGSGDQCPEDIMGLFLHDVEGTASKAFENYHYALEMGVARELARIQLPVNTYSRMRWQCDLRNLFNFLRLRMAPGAQYEIRVYANAIAEIVRAAFPIAYAAFENHVLNSVTLSRDEVKDLVEFLMESTTPEQRQESPIQKILKLAA